jgi:hypothetical protein
MVVPSNAETPADSTNNAIARAELARIGEITAVDVISSAGDAGSVVKALAEAVMDTSVAKLGVEDVAKELKPDGVGIAAGAEPVEGVSAATTETKSYLGGTVFNLIPMVPFTTDIPESGYKVLSPSAVMYPLLTSSILATNIAEKVFWRLKTLGSDR